MCPQNYGAYRMNYKKAENSAKLKARKRSVYGPSGGAGGIRTHVPLRTNGFQDRLVMTTSIQLHVSFIQLYVTRNKMFWGHIWGHIQSFQHRTNPQSAYFIGFLSFSPNEVNRISRPPRYDHFDTAPCKRTECIVLYKTLFFN